MRRVENVDNLAKKLSDDKVAELLSGVPDWKRNSNKIERQFKFKNFVEALKFVNSVGGIAEEEGHHPDIMIHYNQVTLSLYTHVVGGLTENDFNLAQKVSLNFRTDD